MIGDPIALTIRRNIERAPRSLVRAFAKAQTSFIADAQQGFNCLHYAIKPVTRKKTFAGTAITAMNGPRDNLAAMAMLDVCRRGDVLVIATGEDESGAVVGEGPVVMPQSDDWSAFRDSTGVRVDLDASRTYRLELADAPNMTLLEHFSLYTGGLGGGATAWNRSANVRTSPRRRSLARGGIFGEARVARERRDSARLGNGEAPRRASARRDAEPRGFGVLFSIILGPSRGPAVRPTAAGEPRARGTVPPLGSPR